MAYITKSNANKIISGVDLKAVEFSGILYKRPVYFFNELERNRLLAFYNFYKNPGLFTQKYQKIESKDNFEFLWEGGMPAYHKDNSCEKIHSSFRNFRIPEKIRNQGHDAVLKFKKLAKEANKNNVLNENSAAFMESMRIEFNEPYLSEIEPVKYDNSGQDFIENIRLEELENKIDELFIGVNKFICDKDDYVHKLITWYDKYTYCATKGLPFPQGAHPFDEKLGTSEDELRMILKSFENKFKVPIANLLKEYYRIRFNPDLLFEGELLEQLGFKKCSFCFDENL